ncbi:MAG: peptidase E [Actinobacteria bacterium]|nr:MAG: peptidase E [Actinomycetota bacterium]
MPIIAMGGYPNEPLLDDVLQHARGREVLVVPTAANEDPAGTLAWYTRLRALGASMSHAHFFPWPPSDLRERTLASDVVVVPGGNTANMLAIWRTHGFDAVLREAWDTGVVLTGWSAGAICWFEHAVTDSFGPQLEPMECLGFLPGSACPHYDGEALRRPRYAELVRGGFPPGIAIDDAAAVRFDGRELTEVVTSRAGAGAYRVSSSGEERLEARLVSG